MRSLCGGVLLAIFLGSAAARAADVQITHGPILGRLSDDGVGVWARTQRAGPITVRYGTSPDNLDGMLASEPTTVEHDYTGWVHVTGLMPNTKYYYTVDGGAGGYFRTLPRSADYIDPELNPRGLFNFAFEFGCGNNQTPGNGAGTALPGYQTMLRELPDYVYFSIMNGDWLYEDMREYSPRDWARQVGITPSEAPRVVRAAPTICGVWENYKTYLTRGKPLAEYHRVVPNYFVFDDHEILNDVWGCGTPGLRDRRAVFRDIGVQAWYDYLGWANPVDFKQGIYFGITQLTAGSDILEDPEADFTNLDLGQAATLLIHWGGTTAGVNENELDGVGGDPNAGVYRIEEVIDKTHLKIWPPVKEDGQASYSIGRRSYYKLRVSNCEYFMLDTKTHRQMHDKSDPGKKGLSMLGPNQKKWLLDGIAASDADFIFVVSSVNFMVPHVGGGKVRTDNKDDAWTVFLDEREQLIDAFDKAGKPVFVLTGDLHNSFVIRITDRVWEIASGPHNSNNHWSTDEGDRPATGRFKYGPRECDIRWSSFYRNDIAREELQHPIYCVVQVNNVFNNPLKVGETRWVAFPHPQVIFQHYDGRTGKLLYAEAISTAR